MEVGHDCFSGAFELILHWTAYNKILRDVFEWICMQLTVSSCSRRRGRRGLKAVQIGSGQNIHHAIMLASCPLPARLPSNINQTSENRKPKPQEPNKLLPSSA